MKNPKLSDILKAKDSSEISLDDLRSQISALAAEDSRFTTKPEGASEGFCGRAWTDNILFDDGEWSAIIVAVDGKLWEVGFTVEGGAVESLEDDAKEVKRKTSYIAASEPFKFNGAKVTDEQGATVKAVGIPTPEVDESFTCKDVGVPISDEKQWEFGKPTRLMWAPGGTNFITCGCCDPLGRERAVRVYISADKDSAKSVQEDFERLIASTPRRPPFICIEHHEEEKAMDLLDSKKNFKAKFEWDNSPEPAIYCTGIPTKLGEGNVNGHIHTSFSPSFRHDARVATAKCEDCEELSAKCECGGTLYFPEGVRGSEKNPAKIVGIARKSAGSLTNWPAFKDILPVTAKEPTTAKAAQSIERKVADKTNVNEVKSEAVKAMEHSMEAEFDPSNKSHSEESSMAAEEATKKVELVPEESKARAHKWAAKAHEAAGKACSNQNWQMENHHSNQAALHNRYAKAAADEKHPEHSRAMNFKATEPKKKNIFEGVKIISQAPKSIYDGVVVNGQPAGR